MTVPTRSQEPIQWPALAEIVGIHMDEQAQDQSRNAFVLQLDGSGKTSLLDALERYLVDEAQEDWIVVRFSAWEYQRVAPPWWWLIAAIDRQGVDALSPRARWRFRLADMWWHLHRAKLDWLVAGLLAVALVAWALIAFVEVPSGLIHWMTTAVGVVAPLVAVIRAAAGILNSHVLLTSPRGAAVLLRSSRDPLELVKMRYRFLVETFDRPLAIFVDELDRCKARYVVELLEGIRTLLVDDPNLGTKQAKVAFVVAARDDWLCESYRHEYRSFSKRISRPGRQFGMEFLDRAFDFSLRIPESRGTPVVGPADPDLAREIRDCENESALRHLLATARLDDAARRATLRRLESLDDDTHARLRQLAAELELRPEIVQRLPVSYRFELATQILSGRAIEDDEHAIERLARWTVVSLEWPLLARYLERHPDEADRLSREQVLGDGLPGHIHEVASLPWVRRVAFDGESGLTPRSIRRFTG